MVQEKKSKWSPWRSYETKTDGIIHQYDMHSKSIKVGVVGIYLLCALMALVFLYPIVWLLFACLKEENALFQGAGLIPEVVDWTGLKNSFVRLDYGNAYFYSLYICVGSIVCSILFNGLCGYALGVLKMRGHKLLWNLMLALMLVPTAGNFVMLYRNMVALKMNQGQMWPLFLSAGGAPFTIMLFKVFFENLPKDYFEAARLDGCSDMGMFFRIVLPLSTPIISIVAINGFTAAWSDFLMPYLCLNNSGRETVMVKLFKLSGQNGQMMDQLRASLFSILPPVIFFCIFQKYIMNNNMAVGVKG